MAWFGETFGDSLNSLKGQISKITKEVLAENVDDENPEETQTLQEKYQELEAYCASKDLEITSLRDENLKLNQQYQAEIEYLRNENKRLKRNGDVSFKSFEITDDQIQQMCELENQLRQAKEEKEYLSQCLEELQNEHEKNLMEVVKVRDFYKSEMERISHEFNALKSEHEKLLKQGSEDDVEVLRQEIAKLQFQVEAGQREKEESFITIKKEIVEHENLKGKLEKLVCEIQVLNEEKHKTDAENKKFKTENEILNKKVCDLENQLKNANLNNQIESELECMRNKIDDLQLENSTLSEKLKNSEGMDVENKKLKIENESLNEKVSHLESQLNDLNLNNQIENELECLRKKINELQIENLAFLEKLKNSEGMDIENKKLKIENESLSNKISYLESQLKDLNLNNQIENELECLRKKVNELQIENSAFSEKLKNSEDLSKQITYFKGVELETLKILKNLLNKINCNVLEDEGPYFKLLMNSANFIENYIRQKEEVETSLKEINKNLEEEVLYFKNECQNLQVELMTNKEELKNACARIESQQQNCMIQSQTDDVKRLEQELIRLTNLLEVKVEELNTAVKSRNELEQELEILKSMTAKRELELENEVSLWKNSIAAKEEQFSKLYEEKIKNEERLKSLENDHLSLSQLFNSKEKELEEALISKFNLEKFNGELKEIKENLESQLEDLKAQIIVKETIAAELKKANDSLNAEFKKFEEEMTKWKDACVDLEVDRQNLQEDKNALENEVTNLKLEINKYAEEIARLQQENTGWSHALQGLNQNQTEAHPEILAENNQLKAQIMEMQLQLLAAKENLKQEDQLPVQQHRRTRSDVHFESTQRNDDSNLEIERYKNSLMQEQSKYKQLQNEHQELKEKESNLRKELERLRIHLVEVEDHYTAEAVEREKAINELKSKLNTAEEQLKNSSTIYKSANVRANQHLESLQSQIKLISLQRDDLQAKLSAAEDEVQKHTASLTSLQIVLEQFQQDKEREIEGIVTKYEYQIQLSHRRFKEFETEIESLKKQLADAKNGLNAASRLGEQLDKKSQQIIQLEEELRRLKEETSDMENKLSVANQSNVGKIDKSLIKNLVVGYISSPQPDRKAQVLRIMSSVLDFNQDERAKLGVDNTSSGWLSNLLHPKSDHAQNTQSLSEAFIRFLESESRPQPHLKLLPEQSQAEKPGSSRTSPKPSLLLSEFVLPTFNSSHATESSSILKDVLRDS